MNADGVIAALGMFPLEGEGGHCAELYRAARTAAGETNRSCGSAIHYLLKAEERSEWHKLDADELWFHHSGCPARQFLISPDGELREVTLGPSPENGELPCHLVPAGFWQCTVPVPRHAGEWVLFSTVVVPGFEYAGYCADPGETPAGRAIALWRKKFHSS